MNTHGSLMLASALSILTLSSMDARLPMSFRDTGSRQAPPRPQRRKFKGWQREARRQQTQR
jgi:hypothetical protein